MMRLLWATTLLALGAGALGAQSQTQEIPATMGPGPTVTRPGCHVAAKGARQGQFKAESTAKGADYSNCHGFFLGLVAPRDAASGQASGKRQWKPVVFTKEWGAASPQFLQAAATNEVLTTVTFEFTKTNPQGQEYTFQTVTLTNATVSEMDEEGGNQNAVDAAHPVLDRISLTFQKIVVENKDGKTTFADDWLAAAR